MKSTRISCEFCEADDQSGDELIGLTTDGQGYVKIEEDLHLSEIHVCETHADELRMLLLNRLTVGVAGGVDMIAQERWRQKKEKGYTAEHDDEHDKGELTRAAAYYAVSKEVGQLHVSIGWPFSDRPPTDHTRIEELAKAGALIAAEIDRLLRAEKNKSGE